MGEASINPKEVQAVTAMLMMPKLAPVVRMRDEFDTTPTVTIRPWVRASTQWTPGQTVNPPSGASLLIPLNDMLWAQFRRGLYSWCKIAKAYSPGLITNWAWHVGRDTNGYDNQFVRVVGAANPAAEMMPLAPMSKTYVSAGSTSVPPGDTELFGVKAGVSAGGQGMMRGIWQDKNTVTTATFSIGATAAGTLIQYGWGAGGGAATGGGSWQIVSQTAYVATNGSVAAPATTRCGWFAYALLLGPLEAFTQVTVTEAVTYTAVTGNDCVEWHNMPSLVVNRDNVEGLRVMAYSGLIKNVTAPLYQEGVTGQYQVPGNVEFLSFINNGQGGGSATSYQSIISSEKTRAGKWKDGMYSFAKISKASDLDMKTPFVFASVAGNQQIQTDAYMDMDDKCDWLLFYASTTQGPSPSGGDSWIELCWAAEFPTSNDFFEDEPPMVLPGSWRAAVEAQATCPQHYENKIHLAAIWKGIGTLGRLAGPILSAFQHPWMQAAGAIASGIGGFEEQSRKRGWGAAIGDWIG